MEGGLVKCQPLYSRTFSLLSSIVIPLLAVPTEFWGRGEEGERKKKRVERKRRRGIKK